MKSNYDVVIVGAGPAGLATAMHLVRHDQGWVRQIAVIEKATFPRDKLCAGGLTYLVDDALAELGLELGVKAVDVEEVVVSLHGAELRLASTPAFRVVRRSEFDAWLFASAKQRGIEVLEGVCLQQVTRSTEAITLHTSQGKLSAQVVVAADGANSRVRQSLGFSVGRRGRLLEVVSPAAPLGRVARFDFALDRGIQGYLWSFPSPCGGSNRGVVDMRVDRRQPRARMRQVFLEDLGQFGASEEPRVLEGAGVRWFQLGAPAGGDRVLFVGDAAGVDPLMAEGIPFALGYGQVAAAAIVAAFDTQTFNFARFHRQVLRSRWGRHLLFRRALAQGLFHRGVLHKVTIGFWHLVCRLVRGRLRFERKEASV